MYDDCGNRTDIVVGQWYDVQTYAMDAPMWGQVRAKYGDSVVVFLPHVIRDTDAPGFEVYSAVSGGMVVRCDVSAIM